MKTLRRAMIKTTAALGAGRSRFKCCGSGLTRPQREGTGKPGDFGFFGRRVEDQEPSLERQESQTSGMNSKGEATCWTILNGVGSIEELRIPARDFAGMGLRLLDTEKGRMETTIGVNAKNPVLTTPGTTREF